MIYIKVGEMVSGSHTPRVILADGAVTHDSFCMKMIGAEEKTKPFRGTKMSVISMKQLLEGGVHLGHQTCRWNPKMKKYIFTERNGIYIIDLQKNS